MSRQLMCHQVNLQSGFGGGEVYTAAFTQALANLGVVTQLYVHPKSKAWQQLNLPSTVRKIAVEGNDQLLEILRRAEPGWVVCHTLLPALLVKEIKELGHYVTAFVHMPLHGRSPDPLKPFDLLFPVSAYVQATLLESGICPDQVYLEPLYGVAYLDRDQRGGDVIQRHSCFEWDRRKVRERFLGQVEPFWEKFRRPLFFAKRDGLTLGIVSRLTPIKQFPVLLSLLAPIIARLPDVHLEIFGSGGYASVRDMRQALEPIASRVRFWGHQTNVASVYEKLDALLTGLPEKEALGLNVIEAQNLGLPVLAPDAPPFNETVLHEVTGLRYCDPRKDHGLGFEKAISQLRDTNFCFDHGPAKEHLARFSSEAFETRCGKALNAVIDRSQGRLT
jgi:glycosyltransferase involved in cell wall biosynthesis